MWLKSIIPTLIMVLVVALLLFLLCDTCTSFVFYMSGFLMLITLFNLFYLSKEQEQPKLINGENILTNHERFEFLKSIGNYC